MWSAETGISATATVGPVEPPVAVRYELTRIVGEALVNVHRHAAATRVGVTVTVVMELMAEVMVVASMLVVLVMAVIVIVGEMVVLVVMERELASILSCK